MRGLQYRPPTKRNPPIYGNSQFAQSFQADLLMALSLECMSDPPPTPDVSTPDPLQLSRTVPIQLYLKYTSNIAQKIKYMCIYICICICIYVFQI